MLDGHIRKGPRAVAAVAVPGCTLRLCGRQGDKEERAGVVTVVLSGPQELYCLPSSWLLMVRDSPRAPHVVLVNAETADAAPVAGWAADSVRDRGTPGCRLAGLAAGPGACAGRAGAGAAVVPPIVVFVVTVAWSCTPPACR